MPYVGLYLDIVEYFMKEHDERERESLAHRIRCHLEVTEEERRRHPDAEPVFDLIEHTK